MKKITFIIICLAVILGLLSGCKQDIQAEDIDKTNSSKINNIDISSDEKLFSANEIDIETSRQTKDNAYKSPNIFQNNTGLDFSEDKNNNEKNYNDNKNNNEKKLDENKNINAKKIVRNEANNYENPYVNISKIEMTLKSNQSKKYNDCPYYNKNDFYSTMNLEVDKTYEDVLGLVCTHHLLASELLHEGFLKIEDRDAYDKVLILGPDHNTTDSKNIYTSNNDWGTPFGILEIEDKSIETLLTYSKIVVDNELMEKEHSNSALVPFIKYYFKEAKVINIAIPGTLDFGEILDFSRFLEENIIDDKTLFIASIDFSHYLDYERANLKDMETIEEIKKNNYLNIYNFTNDNLDSPQSMITFLDIMNKKNKELNIINNKNSFDIISIDDKNTTSYFTLIYN